ncbi:pleckstrin homology domain-containing family G member 6 [Talpa occidentalis]|uniref:pleckstrin homology domain-containing family G member 6 n=1 Tax=Talpa occidentalis TaxID=50954 RepID=UPI00188E0A58|nr:pleckstrin homology domain-containing family G member 6 [Talpa occidentalis]
MRAVDSPDWGVTHGLVASRIETYGGKSQTNSLHPRGVSKLEFPNTHELETKLHEFSMYGIPRLPPEDQQHWEIGEGNWGSLATETSWKELVPGHKEMSRDLCHQQEALWELLTTELIYVQKLKIMTDLIVNSLLNLHRVGLLTEVSAEPLFGSVPSLIRAHQSFWEEVLGPTLQETRASGQPLDPVSLQNGFLKFKERFHPYVKYCTQVRQTMAHARELQDSNHLFHVFVQWCEKHKCSGRQQLGDLLIKPHQRITKYPLLLQAVLKRSPEARAQEALTAMIGAVVSFLRDINKKVRQSEEQKSLEAATKRIGRYEVLEPSNEEVEKRLRPFSSLNLLGPITGVASEHTRQLLHEGPARVKEGREAKLDVYLLLFSDVLLVTKPQRRTDQVKVIRAPLMLDKLVCQPLREPNIFLMIHLTEFQCASSALIVHCPSPADRARWLEKTQQAQSTLQKLKIEEYTQQRRDLLALYRDQKQESPGTRPSTPSTVSLESSQSSTEERTSEFSAVNPRLVVTEDTEEEAPSGQEDTSDSGYGTLVSNSSRGFRSPLSRARPRALRRDPRLIRSTLDLRDVSLRPQPPDPQALQRRSAPELPEEGIRQGGTLPRGPPAAWSGEEERTLGGENVVVESLHRARLRGQVPLSPAHTDSAGESPRESSGDEEEEPSFFFHHLRAEDRLREDRLREIREDLACQRIEGIPEPRDCKPQKLTQAQLLRMRGNHVIQLDSTLTTSEA